MIPTDLRIFVCTESIDMRYGFDRLAAAVRARRGGSAERGAVCVRHPPRHPTEGAVV